MARRRIVPNFTPIGSTCRSCWAKNLEIGLRVNLIPARCASRNAAGNDGFETVAGGEYTTILAKFDRKKHVRPKRYTNYSMRW